MVIIKNNKMKILEIYKAYSIPFITEGNKHARDGWVNTHCPFCPGEQNYHLGYNLEDNYYNCWRCGPHFVDKTLEKLLNITHSQATQIIRQYGGTSHRIRKESKVKVSLTPFKFPSGELKLRVHHKKYLARRSFDYDKLAYEWQVTGTGPVSYLDGTNYSHRILAPIYWDGKVVSFQTRSLREDDPIKYLACPMARELIEHQHILYGNSAAWGKRGVCVEGITDVWRLGVKSFAVFGIDYTPFQVREIKKHFEEVVILFDPDPQAQRQANKLMAELEFRGVKAWKESVPVDPGSLTQQDADYLMKQLL